MDDLESLEDGALSEVFAVEICETVKPIPSNVEGVRFYEDTRNGALRRSDWRNDFWTEFCTDANAVLPWLEKCDSWQSLFDQGEMREYTVTVWPGDGDCCDAESTTFARAACLALIRAKRASAQPKPL